MIKRHFKEQNNQESDDITTFTTPKIVAKPKTDKGKKIYENEVRREDLIAKLTANYLDPIRGNKQRGIPSLRITGRDLAVINDPHLFKDVEPKPDRRKNRAIDYMIVHLDLLHFLLGNFSGYYKKKLTDSPQFKSLLQKYLGIDEYSQIELSQEDRKERLNSAIQWLIDSLTVIEDSLPITFKEALKESSKTYFKLINAIADNEKIKIHIPDKMYR